MVDELGFKFPVPFTLEVDNQTAIHFAKGTTKRSKMKHIDARQSWVEALRDHPIVQLKWVPTADNLADLNSKLLPVQRFEALRAQILRPRPVVRLQAAAVAA